MDSKSLFLTANTSTLYTFVLLDTENDGPIVLEIPPGMLGFVNDAWFQYVADMGIAGPDKGKGGKYLVLPPGYKGNVPRRLLRGAPEDLLDLGTGARFHGKGPQGSSREHEVEVQGLPAGPGEANPPKTEFIDMLGQVVQTPSRPMISASTKT